MTVKSLFTFYQTNFANFLILFINLGQLKESLWAVSKQLELEDN